MYMRRLIPALKMVVDAINNKFLSRYSTRTLITLYRLLYHAKINCNECEAILRRRGIDPVDAFYLDVKNFFI